MRGLCIDTAPQENPFLYSKEVRCREEKVEEEEQPEETKEEEQTK